MSDDKLQYLYQYAVIIKVNQLSPEEVEKIISMRDERINFDSINKEGLMRELKKSLTNVKRSREILLASISTQS